MATPFNSVKRLGLILAALSAVTACVPPPPAPRTPEGAGQSPSPPGQPQTRAPTQPGRLPPQAPAPVHRCMEAPQFAPAAADNAASLTTLVFAPFRRPEIGWDVYLPLIAREIGTSCPPNTSGFAADLAQWEGKFNLPTDGRVTPAVFDVFKGVWQERRPFVMATLNGACPDHPDQLGLVLADRSESFGGKLIQVRRGALLAYRQMVAAARQAVPEVAADPTLLQIFSGYRSPEADDFRCLTENNCQGVTRAKCSAHRTALALDLDLGFAPGFTVDNASDPNRRYLSQSAAYRWLVQNAGRFGFVNYPFEPWHWEWTGETP